MNPSVFSNLVRTAYGAGTVAGDTGLLLGGWAAPFSDKSITGTNGIVLPGIVSFNMTSKLWSNDTATPFQGTGTNFYGQAEFVPSFGPHGLVVFMGGISTAPAADYNDNGAGLLDFYNLTLYDPIAKSWYAQICSGDFPSRRDMFCTVGVQGPNNTYELFVYGGQNFQQSRNYDEIYVLSLPGFVWFKANYTPTSPRAIHKCVVVGKRQMLSVGGVNSFAPTSGWKQPDSMQQGLGIFDLSAMTWRDEYDSNAKDYDSPQVVKDWYDQGKLKSVQWTSPALQTIFVNSTSPSNPTLSNKKSTSVGPIVGGVLGGIALFVLVAAALFFARRHRRKQPHGPAPNMPINTRNDRGEWYKPELDGQPLSPPRTHRVTGELQEMQ